MKLSLPALFAALLLGTIFTSCQSSPEASANIWRRPDYFGGPKKSVAVAVLAYHADVRKEVEDALVARLRQQGVNARATYPVVDTQTIVSNKPAAIERARALGVKAVLAVRMVDRETLKVVQISPGNNGKTLAPWQNWFEFFSAPSAFVTNPENVQVGNVIGAQATFYESPSGTLLWSATFTHMVNDSPAQVDQLASALVAKLHSAALIP
ncbi:hypothetical protein TSACC_2553 [Terrimicrobium sacchariphilum]|uniref:DUF4136 domain-containing protein n=1 Tax=Terrimicrobium sacchariphilum TaxID=690879 RepID=A0A146G601_TERSA|nr:hypothetical protein [Terrimicrobium sacchariphilum]GAT32156.1 hypothetical protein TSACC_2553 [Terrimicrobium sacchariphilum]